MGRFREAWRALTKRSIKDTDKPWSNILDGAATSSGVNVTPDTSLRVAAVYAGVRLIAESISSLPVDVIRRQGGRRITVEDEVTELLTERPNEEMDAPEMWRTVLGWELLHGDGYVYIQRDGNGTPVELWPLPANGVWMWRDRARRPYYQVAIPSEDHAYPNVPRTGRVGPENMLHFRAFGTGFYGLSPIGQIREAVGTSLAAQRYMAKFYDNDAKPGGFIAVPDNLTDEQYQRLEASWKAAHQGLDKAHLMAIMEGGARWESVGLNPNDAAFIETQKWETTEIARALGIPPHMIGDVERSTSWGTGIAEQGIGFVTYTLTPWITRLEQVTKLGLLRPLDRRLRVKWRVEGLQRGDTKSRYEAYQVGRNWGWLSANDVRALEDMDPIPEGDTYLQPLNMVPAGTETDPDEGRGPPEPASRQRSAEGRRRLTERYIERVTEADRKLAKLERAEVNKLARKHLDGDPRAFRDALDELYRGKVRDRYVDNYKPVLAALAADIVAEAADEQGDGDETDLSRFVDSYVNSHADHHQGSMRGQLKAALDEADRLADAIEAKMGQQVDERPERRGKWEAHQMANAAAREQWRDSGVRAVRWSSGRRGCPYCDRLDGREVGIEEPFAREGDEIDGDEDSLAVDRTIQHPPAHPGCDCRLVPA